MSQPADFLRSTLAEDVTARARDRLDDDRAALVARLAAAYLAGIPGADLEKVDGDQVFAILLGLLAFARDRVPATPKLRVFDPDPDRNGWSSPHSVIEIINDDMPFLVDSVTMVLAQAGIGIHLLVHPILAARRDGAGTLTGLEDAPVAGGTGLESLMHVEIDRQDAAALARVGEAVAHVLAQVRAAIADWQAMRARIRQVGHGIGGSDDSDEAVAFLDWLHDDHFTFLGYRHFLLSGGADAPDVRADAATGLGILRDECAHVFDEQLSLSDMPAEIRAFLARPGVLLVTKSARRSVVHRPVHMDIIGIKDIDADGRVVGLHAFLGLFTSAAYTRNPADIPLLRRKVTRVQARAGFPPYGHDAKALANILETYPRDELFQMAEDQLLVCALGILHLLERPRVALFSRRDEFGRFVSCLIFLPRDRYDTPLRLTVIRLLEQAYGGQLDAYYTQVSDGPLARLHVIVRTQPGQVATVDEAELELRIAEAARSWSDHLQSALVQAHGEGEGLRLARRWRDAFPLAYRETHSALAAVTEIGRLEAVAAGADLGVNLYRPIEAGGCEARLKLIHAGTTVPLSDVLPLLEAMGLRVIAEVPHAVRPADGPQVWIHDVQLETAQPLDLAARSADFEAALLAVWRGQSESDGFNRLVLSAGLTWRQVTVLRAYAKYLRQAGSTLSQAYVEGAVAANPEQAAALMALFLARFGLSAEGEAQAEARVLTMLDRVASADDDRILRRFLNLIRATLRTNYGLERPYLSLKLDSRAVDDLPLPRPLVEVFVYSPRMEGIHLRGGLVARGGIRWSDRREDFRTEILGLMKAQMVKNAVIVPVGAKGGFVVKRPPAGGGREALLAEGIACYQTLIRGLLDITDTLKGGTVVAPAGLVRHDGDDPYLVVAADKGTASFSDIANALSLDYGFWLGDAFASGGSKGYDHKAMGITARGAWEAVKRHFRELAMDVQAEDVTVVGVGDMSGDVFGNAMLCSRHIRLVAAFNHSHIFIDPAPDAAASFAERERLFKAVKSWPDYDPALISAGGGVFSRAAKTIAVSPEMRERFAIDTATITPNALIQRLLTHPTDLLFFGGIGTYVKASRESQAEAGDRANDAVRVNGAQLRARVVGEGANLGCTQLGRIEYALAGGRLNTDAIDNSAGVDTSDHEVNIKILLGDLVVAGDLTGKQRDTLLAAMTDEVAALVLRDNYLQTQALSVMAEQGAELLDGQARFMRVLEKLGRLDRAIEFLPDDETLTERAARRQGLVRPELAVLLAYAKLWLHDGILASPLPDDPFLAGDLARYFPTALHARFAEAIAAHRLRREIVATTVTNSMINRVGVAFVADLMEKTGHGPADVARAYIVARDAYGVRAVWGRIEALDGLVPAAVQSAMLAETGRLLERATAWVLRCVPVPFQIGAAISELKPGIAALQAALPAILPADTAEGIAARRRDYQAQGVPAELAAQVADLIVLASAADIVRIAAHQGSTVEDAGSLYFAIGHRFGLGALRLAAQKLAGGGHWQKLASAAAIEDLYGSQRDITVAVAAEAPGLAAADALAAWIAGHRVTVERTDAVLAEVRAARQIDLAMLTVAGRQLKTLVEA